VNCVAGWQQERGALYFRTRVCGGQVKERPNASGVVVVVVVFDGVVLVCRCRVRRSHVTSLYGGAVSTSLPDSHRRPHCLTSQTLRPCPPT